MIHEQLYELNMTEEQILQTATDKFQSLTGFSLKQIPPGSLSKHQKLVMDTRLRLKLGKRTIEFAAEIKNEIRQEQLSRILDLINKNRNDTWLIISQYIPKPLKAEMRNYQVNYLEASGNCYIRDKDLFIYINDQPVTQTRLPEQGKLWKSAGLRFLFIVLQYPQLINEPYRSLARISKVALGNIGPFIDELKSEGYLKRGNHGQFLFENTEQLRRKWIELFPTVLRPKIKMGSFRFMDKDMNRNWKDIPNTFFRWGGEPAGALLTNYLNPEKFTMYTSFTKLVLMKQLKLIPDENGNVELLETFWNENDFSVYSPSNRQDVVSPFLAYAELVISFDSRNRETAERIKEMYFEH